MYPDLVNVFSANLKVHENKLKSRMRMLVSSSIWRAIAGIKCEGLKIGKRNLKPWRNITKLHSIKVA